MAKYVMEAPHARLIDVYSGDFRREYVEHAYSGDILVVDGIARVDSEEFRDYLYARGYTLVPDNRYCKECDIVFKSPKEYGKHLLEVHRPKRSKKK